VRVQKGFFSLKGLSASGGERTRVRVIGEGSPPEADAPLAQVRILKEISLPLKG